MYKQGQWDRRLTIPAKIGQAPLQYQISRNYYNQYIAQNFPINWKICSQSDLI